MGPVQKQFRPAGASLTRVMDNSNLMWPMWPMWQAPNVGGKKPRSEMTPEERAQDNQQSRLRKMHATGVTPPVLQAAVWDQAQTHDNTRKLRKDMTPEERKADNHARRLRAAMKGAV